MENPSGRLGRSAPAQPQPRRGPKSLAGDLKARGLPVLGPGWQLAPGSSELPVAHPSAIAVSWAGPEVWVRCHTQLMLTIYRLHLYHLPIR